MKYCTKCGQELVDDAVVCTNCGCAVQNNSHAPQSLGIDRIIKAFLIVGTVVTALMLCFIPLAWCIPMTISINKKLEKGEPISTGFKVCTLIFVSLIAGILLLCRSED